MTVNVQHSQEQSVCLPTYFILMEWLLLKVSYSPTWSLKNNKQGSSLIWATKTIKSTNSDPLKAVFHSFPTTIPTCWQPQGAQEEQQGRCWVCPVSKARSCSPQGSASPSQGSRAGPGFTPRPAALVCVQPQQTASASSQAFCSPGFCPSISPHNSFL